MLLGTAFAFAMVKRSTLLEKTFVKAQQQLFNDYKINLTVVQYGFEGLNTIRFGALALVPEERDTLVVIDQIEVEIAIWPLLFGSIRLSDLQIYNASVSLVKKDTLSNYDFLLKKSKKDSLSNQTQEQRNFALWVDKLAKKFFSFVPNNMTVKGFSLAYQDNQFLQKLFVPEAKMENGRFETSLLLNDGRAEWVLKGEIKASDQKFRLEVASAHPNTELPFLKRKYGLSICFDKLLFDLASVKHIGRDMLQINGGFGYENLVVKHWRISDDTIILPSAKVEGGLELTSDYFALKKGTKIKVKDFILEPSFKFTAKPNRRMDLGVHTGFFRAQSFFDALPEGLFEMLYGVKVEGEVAFDLDFSVELDNPDSIVFKSSIDDVDLKVLSWGNARIDSLSFPFIHDVYEGSVLERRILVGAGNPKFIPFKDIPIELKTAVRHAEDPLFYQHNGFDEEAFKLSISTNLKEKRFKRGASTLSMQLVKNLYLSRKKTISRKLEEILLVWLMESSNVVSKDRMFEIYLNVIEWGRKVYGVEEAAQYYFNKSARELNLGESLFLSSIIPRPKTGLSSFDYTGHLKPWLQRYFNIYGTRMSKVGDLNHILVPEGYGFYDVLLKSSLRPKAPENIDTVGFDQENIDVEFLKELIDDKLELK